MFQMLPVENRKPTTPLANVLHEMPVQVPNIGSVPYVTT
jgi:hypothetical protein